MGDVVRGDEFDVRVRFSDQRSTVPLTAEPRRSITAMIPAGVSPDESGPCHWSHAAPNSGTSSNAPCLTIRVVG